MTRRIVIAASLIAAAGMVACGGGDDRDDAGAAGGGATPTLAMVDDAFEPASFGADTGAEVEVANEGDKLHNITVEGSDIDEDVDPGASTTVSLDLDPGSYTMFCEYHRSAGMEGTLEVR